MGNDGPPFIPGEEWRSLPLRGCDVSSLGRVRDYWHKELFHLSKYTPRDPNSHIIVGIYPPPPAPPKRLCILVQTLVAEAFLPYTHTASNLRLFHKDMDRQNNAVSNLEYRSHSDIAQIYAYIRPRKAPPKNQSRHQLDLEAEAASAELSAAPPPLSVAIEEYLPSLQAAVDELQAAADEARSANLPRLT
jgi:hypothetical protein